MVRGRAVYSYARRALSAPVLFVIDILQAGLNVLERIMAWLGRAYGWHAHSSPRRACSVTPRTCGGGWACADRTGPRMPRSKLGPSVGALPLM